jgi:spore coat assembly protein SafA
MNMAEFNDKEVTVDIVFGSLGKTLEAVSSAAQQGLLEAFKAAANLDDLAAKLAIPIQLLSVTGAKVVSAHGYDTYKITVAIRSDNPNEVAKEIFSTGVGIATGAIVKIGGTAALSFTPLSPLGAQIVGTGGGVVVGAIASEYSKIVWDDSIASTPSGEWIKSEITSNFGIGLKITQGTLATSNSANSLPPDSLATHSALVFDPSSESVKAVINQSQTRVVDPDVTDGTDTYIVQKGDSLWKIAVTNGWDFEELKTANPQLSDPNFIRIGQKINGLAPAATTDHFTLATTPDVATAEANPDDPATFNGLLAGNATYSLYGIGDVNALSGNTAYANNTIAGWRPGAYSLVTEILASQLADNFLADPNLASSPVWNPEVTAAALQMLATGVATTIPTDPLILDLNGDGVKLTSFADAPGALRHRPRRR